MHTVVEQPQPAALGASVGESGPPPVIFTVHGTFDAHPDDDGSLWWQRGSLFHQALLAELAKRGIPQIDYRPFHWSGANAESHRLGAARRLAKSLLKQKQGPTIVVGHSHGGNVIVDALARARRQVFPAVVTFGTPFFVRRLKPLSAVVAYSIFLTGFFSGIAPIAFLLLILGVPEAWKLTLLLGPPFLALLYVSRMVFHKRMARFPVEKLLEARMWLAIHSSRDEAIIALANAASIKPSYVGPEAAERAVTRIGTFAGVATALVVFPVLCAHPELVTFAVPELVADQGPWSPGVIMRAYLYLPSVFAVVFSLFWIIAKLGGARAYGFLMNTLVHGGVIGSVYGSDAAYAVKGVSLSPMNLPNPEDLHLTAATLGKTHADALAASVQSIYGDLIEAASANSPLDPNTFWKRMSGGLYHNAYTHDRGVIEAVADHIAACLKDRKVKLTLWDRVRTSFLPI
jgi:hypothetical protein